MEHQVSLRQQNQQQANESETPAVSQSMFSHITFSKDMRAQNRSNQKTYKRFQNQINEFVEWS